MAKARVAFHVVYGAYLAACAAGKTRQEFADEQGYKGKNSLASKLNQMQAKIDAENVNRIARGEKPLPFPKLKDARNAINWDTLADIAKVVDEAEVPESEAVEAGAETSV